MSSFSSILVTIVPFVVVILSVVLHEIGHGYMALRLGDTTAQRLGRLTLNPIPHIDPFYTILLPLILHFSGSPVVFGSAKPVPVNPGQFDNVSPRKGMMLVAAAGPAVNFALVGISLVILHIMNNQSLHLGNFFLVEMVMINAVLGLFNLFPVPPLDGSKIIAGLLPKDLAFRFMRIERFGFFILALVLLTGIHRPFLEGGMDFIFNLLPRDLFAALHQDLFS